MGACVAHVMNIFTNIIPLVIWITLRLGLHLISAVSILLGQVIVDLPTMHATDIVRVVLLAFTLIVWLLIPVFLRLGVVIFSGAGLVLIMISFITRICWLIILMPRLATKILIV